MDNRLKFLYHLIRLSDGGTQEGRGSRGWKCASKRCRRVSRQIRSPQTLSRDGEGNLSTEVPDPTLPRKASSEEQGARTANRHR